MINQDELIADAISVGAIRTTRLVFSDENGYVLSESQLLKLIELTLKRASLSANENDAERWITHAGSEYCPFDENVQVDIKRRDGSIVSNVYAFDWNWTHSFLATHHHIVAYRLAIANKENRSE